MNAKVVGVVISFTALATLLNYIKIPVPYLAGFFYQLGDVVLIVTLLLFGAKPAITIASLNMVLAIVLYQNPAGPIGPPYYLISVLATFFGIYLALRIKGHRRATRRHLLELASISTNLRCSQQDINYVTAGLLFVWFLSVCCIRIKHRGILLHCHDCSTQHDYL
jgi:riboflavin transporter FmnP